MKTLLRTLAALAMLMLALPAHAQLSQQDQDDLRRIEAYLNSMTTVQSRFTQIASNSGPLQGTFYLSRPGRMRIQYDPPVPYMYIADGFWLTYYDAELGQRTDTTLGSSLADFVTRQNIRFGGDVTVTGLRHQTGQIAVDVVQTSDPSAGSLTLIFNENPLELVRWRVLDPQNITTEVWLESPSFGGRLDSSLFVVPRVTH